VMKAIESNTKVNPNAYIAAARYYLDNKKDLKKALEWVDLGIANGDPAAFWNVHLKAQIQKAAGDKAGAKATAQKSLDMARKAENDFGYIKQNEDLIKSL
jgi:TPR repeat protein